MKSKWFTASFAATLLFAASHSASAFIILAETHTDDWEVGRNITVTSGTTLTGASSNIASAGLLSVSQYTGFEQLARVVIRVVQPEPSTSQTISAEITQSSGTSEFSTSTTENRVQERTDVFFSTGLNTALGAAAASGDDYGVTKNSASYNGVTLDVSNPINRSINVSHGPTILFDSDNFSLTEAQLQSIFAGNGSFDFEFEVASVFRWNRTSGTDVMTATLTGVNSGQIIIEYYVVPEPSAALLGGLGMLALLRRRR